MKKKKSSLFFLPLLVIISLVILINLYIVLLSKNEPLKYPIGQRQFDLLRYYIKAESALFYIDQSAKYSLQQAAYDLAKNGGQYEATCGAYFGANIWVLNEGKNCYPTDEEIKNNLQKHFEENFYEYLANHPTAYIPTSYEYVLSDDMEIIGKPTDKIVIDIVPEDFSPSQVKLITTDTNEIYKQALTKQIPQILKVPMKSNPDIETIKLYHPEVWMQYTELCKKMGATSLILGNPPGVCTSTRTKCCITSGYRHPFYNKEIGGATNSPHQYGTALDIYVGNVEEQLKWAKEASNLFTRVGIYPVSDHIHVDLMPKQGDFATTYWIGDKGKTILATNDINQLENEARKIA